MKLTPKANLWLALVALALAPGCQSAQEVTAIGDEPLRVSATRLEFAATWAGTKRETRLTVLNPARASVSFTAELAGPFGLTPPAASLAGGSPLELSIVFSPTLAGRLSSLLMITDDRGRTLEVPVLAEALAVPECPAAATCSTVTFDFDAGTCVTALAADGSDCAPSDSCFATAECRQGQCLGTRTTCEDRNPCTIDACGETGCVHLDGVYDCPAATNPCQTQACIPPGGCTFQNVPDGTSCGVRDCRTAQVCISGQCQQRAVPQNQACVEVVAGLPGGCGFADGLGGNARFESPHGLAVDGAGNVYVADLSNFTVRSITPSGFVATLAGQAGVPGDADGFGSAARFRAPTDVAVDSHGSIFVSDATRIRKISRAGLVTTFAGSAVAGSLDGNGTNARFMPILGMGMGPGDVLWVAERDAIRRVSPLGEVATRMHNPRPPGSDWGLVDVAATPSGRVFFLRGYLMGLGESLADGGQVDVRLGWTVTSASLVATTDEHLLLGTHRQSSDYYLNELSLDGGVGHRASVGNYVAGLAIDSAGRALAGIECGVKAFDFASDAGVLVAGGLVEYGRVVDGPTAAARFRNPGAMVFLPDGAFAVHDESVIRRVGDGQVSTLARSYGSYWSGGNLASCANQLFEVHWTLNRLVADGGAPEELVQLPTGSVLDHKSRTLACLADDPEGLLILQNVFDGGAVDQWIGTEAFRWTADAGLATIAAGFTDRIAGVIGDRAGGYFLLEGNRAIHLTDGGGRATITGQVGAGDLDGPPAVARFRAPGSLAGDEHGNLFIADTGNFSLRRVAPSGWVTTVIRLADAPRAVLVEDGGTLLVTVPNAVLRVHP